MLDGHVVDHAPDIQTARDFTATVSYDLILLDIMLPDGDGRTFLAQHRKRQESTPVIVLTARSEVADRVGLLDLGADDYMIKPIDFAELEARCRAVMRRRGGVAQNLLRLGNLQFDSLSGTLKLSDQEVQLRPRELRLFEVLANAPGQVFSKSMLVDRLFSYDEDVTENAIEVYIGRLRRHLEASTVKIVTIRGLGYKLDIA
jgi:two-component system response regulator TctD